METESHPKHFPLGTLVITSNTGAQLHPVDFARSLARHARGDWGELSPEDREENELSLKDGYRLLSAYTDGNGGKFWIITEADRASTAVLLPEDY